MAAETYAVAPWRRTRPARPDQSVFLQNQSLDLDCSRETPQRGEQAPVAVDIGGGAYRAVEPLLARIGGEKYAERVLQAQRSAALAAARLNGREGGV